MHLKPLTRLFTSSLFCLASFADACDDIALDSITVRAPDLSHVNDAPRSNAARARIIEAWWQRSCPEFSKIDLQSSRSDNLVCRVAGQRIETIVIGAHYDKVQKGHGVADNWSGIVLLDSLKKHFEAKDLKYSLEFVAFAAEERDMQGAAAYLADQTHTAVAMVNLDTLGLRPMIISGESDEYLTCITSRIAEHLSVSVTVRNWSKITGDYEPFLLQGIPAIGLHSVDPTTIKRIHQRRDRRGNVDMELLKDAYRLTEKLIERLAETGLPLSES